MNALDGKKTYIVCAVLFVVAGLKAIHSMVPALSFIPVAVLDQIIDWLQSGAALAFLGFTLRSGMPDKTSKPPLPPELN